MLLRVLALRDADLPADPEAERDVRVEGSVAWLQAQVEVIRGQLLRDMQTHTERRRAALAELHGLEAKLAEKHEVAQ